MLERVGVRDSLARQFETREIVPERYPVAVGGILAAIAAVMFVALPSIWSLLFDNFVQFVGLGASETRVTIAEAQPLLAQGQGVEPIIREYGLTLFVAVAGLLGLLVAPLVRSEETNHTIYAGVALAVVGLFIALPAIPDLLFGLVGIPGELGALLVGALLLVGATFLVRYPVEQLLLVIWALFLLSATFTQLRFSYYLVIPVVVLNAIVLGKVIAYADLDADSLAEAGQKLKRIEGWQLMAISAVLLAVLVPGLIIPVEAAGSAGTAWEIGAQGGPGAVVAWDDSLDWMAEDTPYPGELEGHDNRLEYYGTVEQPPDGNYEYPEGTYGVMSWWDYGHWITVQGERIPYANPFQNNANEAANYLLAADEQQAAGVLDRLNEPNEATAQTRYVMVDWQMVNPGSKFGAPIVWYDDDDIERGDFLETAYPVIETPEGEQFGQPIQIRSQRYYDSQMVRLYEYHGSAADPNPIVVETEPRTVEAQGQQFEIQAVTTETFDSMAEAEAYVDDNPGAQLGGVGANPTERVEALEHYRLAKTSETSAAASGQYVQTLQAASQATELEPEELLQTSPNWVKTFERVPGATIEGSGALADSEVRATVEMETGTGETFTYTQYAETDADGTFEMTVPYSTTGYDEFGPDEGYTDVDVEAVGPYTIVSEGDNPAIGSADVDEAQVVGADDTPVTVELESGAIQVPDDDEPELGDDTDDGEPVEADGDDATQG